MTTGTEPVTTGAAGEGGLVAAAQAAQGQQQGQQQQGQQQGTQGQQQQAPYLPEGLPKELAGANERETLDKLWKAHASLPKPPETPDGYTYAVPKDLEGFINPEKDPVLKDLRGTAHKLGITQAQFEGLVNEVVRSEIKAGRLEKPMSVADVFAELGAGKGDRVAQIDAGQKRTIAISDQIAGLATRQQISQDDAKALTAALYDAPTTRAIERVLALLPKEHGIQNGGQPNGGGQQRTYEDNLRALYPSMYPKAAGGAG